MSSPLLQGQWKSDGLDADGKATWEVTRTAEEDTIALNVTGGSPLNLCYEVGQTTTPRSPPKYFFQVQILDLTPGSSLSVGVVRPSEFLKGYKTKGMFYNGNLTNGSAALKVGYGPYVGTPGDVVVVEYTELEETVVVQFHVNQTLVQPAPAFEIPRSIDTPSGESFFPCLHGMGTLKVSATVTLEQPTPTMPVAASPQQHALQGDWTLLEAWNLEEDDSSSNTTTTRIWPLADEAEEEPPNKQLTLHVETLDSGIWNFSLKVCNMMRMTRSVVTKDESKVWELTGGGGVMSTMMMPPPPYGQVESQLTQVLPRWCTLKLNNSNNNNYRLEVTSNDGLQVLAVLERPQPKTSSGTAVCTSYHNS